MDYFKIDILKKEFEKFKENVLPKVLECGLCKKYSCENHKKLLLSCSQCREVCCSNCTVFKQALEMLLNNPDSDVRHYIENVVTDFLKISNETLINLFNVEKELCENRLKQKTFDAEVYYKSAENSSQFVKETLHNCNKIEYMHKNSKRSFYKKV